MLRPMLAIEKVTKRYEGVQALNQVSLQVRKGMIKGLIGPNGSGKSTLFHLVSGLERPDSGSIYFNGKEITSLEPHQISALGIGRSFQTIQTWGNMTVVDNILGGMHRSLKGGFLSCGVWHPAIKRQEKEALRRAKETLEFLGLLGRWEWPASQISLEEQRMLELGRAIAARPELLLLDEPASGLTPAEIQQLSKRIQQLKQEGMTLFIVEHRMDLVMEVAEEVTVLRNGEMIAQGSPDEVRRDKRVIDAYLKGRGVRA